MPKGRSKQLLGELAVIVGGVLLALFAESQWQQRRDRRSDNWDDLHESRELNDAVVMA